MLCQQQCHVFSWPFDSLPPQTSLKALWQNILQDSILRPLRFASFYSFLLSPVFCCFFFYDEVTLFFISSLFLFYISLVFFLRGSSAPRPSTLPTQYLTKYYIYTCSIGKRLTLKTKQTNIFHHATKNGPNEEKILMMRVVGGEVGSRLFSS